jgi:hypothetical protein
MAHSKVVTGFRSDPSRPITYGTEFRISSKISLVSFSLFAGFPCRESPRRGGLDTVPRLLAHPRQDTPNEKKFSFQFQYKQFCGSVMYIPDRDFYASLIPDFGSRIPDPKTATKERGEKNLLSYFFFFLATNITKLKIILFLNWRRKKFGPIY